MTAFPAPDTEHSAAGSVPDGALHLNALHNIGTAEGIHMWRYEPGHPMTVVFTAVIDPSDLADEVLCEQVFALLNVGHDPADVGLSDGPDQRALDYRERGNRAIDRSTSARRLERGYRHSVPIRHPPHQGLEAEK